MPKFILLLRSTSLAESGTPPPTHLIEAMMSFYASMNSAGIVLGADGLHASSKDAARVIFHEGKDTEVQRGPFKVEEMVSGYWIVNVKDVEEAVGWAKKCPLQDGATIEVRRVVEMDDFKETVTDEIREVSEKMRRETVERLKGEGK